MNRNRNNNTSRQPKARSKPLTKRATAKTSNNNNSVLNLIKGGHFSPADNPPAVTGQPWHPITIVSTSKNIDYTITSLVENFRKQIDPTGNGLNKTDFTTGSSPFRIQFRVQSISVWNLTGRLISLAAYDDFDKTNRNVDQLCGLVDSGGTSTFPKIGFRYPMSHRDRVFRPENDIKDSVIFTTATSSKDDTILVHFKVLFRFDGPIKFTVPTFASPDLQTSLEILALTKQVKEINEIIKSNQPSTLNKVIDGVEKVASVVAIAGVTSSHEAQGDRNLNGFQIIDNDNSL